MKHLLDILRREKIFKVALFIVVVIILGSAGFVYFEDQITYADALWWSVVTLTTVGYGDISPATAGGRFVGMAVMITGIGFLGIFTAAIASVLVENRLLENKGMKAARVSGHFVLCGWNFRGIEIVEELRADPKCESIPIVVIAELSEKPVGDPRLHFIRGDVTPENLKKANTDEAQAVIILSDDQLDVYARDAKTVLTTLTIKTRYPTVYVCAELMDPKNVEHCQMARADEIIVVGELSTNLLVQAALDHGVTRVISELVSNRYGKELYKIELPRQFVQQNFLDVMCQCKQQYGILCLGIEDANGRNFIANPDNDYILEEKDRLIIIASERPNLV